MRSVVVLAVCALASCTTQEQWMRTASTLEVGYGWNRGDLDSPMGNKDYENDSTSVWLSIRPLAAFEPPREVRIVNPAPSYHVESESDPATCPASPHRWTLDYRQVERCADCNRTRFECERDIDEAREELEACRARELVAQGRVARGGSQDGDPARPVPASKPPGLSTSATLGVLGFLGLVISSIAYGISPAFRKTVDSWLFVKRIRGRKRRVEFAQEPRKG